MCGSCRRTWYLCLWCRIETYARVGRILRLIPIRSSHLVTTLVMLCKFHVMSEQHACLPPNASSEVSVLFRTVSLRGVSRFHLCFLGGFLIFLFGARDADALCNGKPCLPMEALDTSSSSTCSSLLTSLESDEYDERNMWNPMLNLCLEYVGAVMERDWALNM